MHVWLACWPSPLLRQKRCVGVAARTCMVRMVQISDDPEDSCEAGFKLACLVADTGAHQAAADLFAPLALRYDDVYGADHPETLQIKSSHATALAAAGMLEDAVQLSGQVFECWTAVGSAESEPAIRAVRHSSPCSSTKQHSPFQSHPTLQWSTPPFYHATQHSAPYSTALCTMQYGNHFHLATVECSTLPSHDAVRHSSISGCGTALSHSKLPSHHAVLHSSIPPKTCS
jgi:hypothetical protein